MERKTMKGVVLMLMMMGMIAQSIATNNNCNTPPPSTPNGSAKGGRGGKGSSSSSGSAHCPVDALKLGACVDLLKGLVHVGIGDPRLNKCCPLIKEIIELEAAACLCTTIRAKVLKLNLVVPVALGLFATCDVNPPKGFTCPSH